MVTSTRPNSRLSTHDKLFNTLFTSLLLIIGSFNVRGLGNVVRLVRLLLSNTKLHVRVGKSKSSVFISLSGAFQGDSLSGVLFTLTLAGALIHLRAMLDRPNPPISDECLPLESEYADDVYFIDEDPEALKNILPVATPVLKEWSFYVNEQKTEVVRVF